MSFSDQQISVHLDISDLVKPLMKPRCSQEASPQTTSHSELRRCKFDFRLGDDFIMDALLSLCQALSWLNMPHAQNLEEFGLWAINSDRYLSTHPSNRTWKIYVAPIAISGPQQQDLAACQRSIDGWLWTDIVDRLKSSCALNSVKYSPHNKKLPHSEVSRHVSR